MLLYLTIINYQLKGKMIMKRLLTSLMIISIFAPPCWATPDIAGQVKATVIKNMETTQAENTAMMMSTIHTQSPYYLMTKQQMEPLFESYDLKYELISYEFIGVSGEYALARVIFRTSKVSGPAFKDNELDVIQIFKQEDGVWKFWSQASLNLKFIEHNT